MEEKNYTNLIQLINFIGQTAPRQPAVIDEQMVVHKEEILDPEDNDENQQVVMGI